MINQPLPEYSPDSSQNIAKTVNFGKIKILRLKEMAGINNNKIKVNIPEKIIAGTKMALEGEVEGPFRAIDFGLVGHMEFVSHRSGESREIKSRINLPLFVPAGKRHRFGISFDSPEAGEYKARLSDKRKKYTFNMEKDSVTVIGYLASSNNSPGKLKTELYVDRKGIFVNPGDDVVLNVRAVNKGDAVWLASAPKDYGTVRVGYSILDKDLKEISAGRGDMDYDIYPGKETDVNLSFKAPITEGRYILKIDMVSEHVTWFEQQGNKPVFMNLVVR